MELGKRFQELTSVDHELHLPQHISSAREKEISQILTSTENLMAAMESQYLQLREAVPDQKASDVRERKRFTPPLSEEKIRAPFFEELQRDAFRTTEEMIQSLQNKGQLEEKKGFQKERKPSDVLAMAEELLRETDLVTTDIMLRYYRYVFLMHNLVKQLISLEKALPDHFKKDSAWLKIRAICTNLQDNLGLLAKYPSIVDIKEASLELVAMLRQANQSKSPHPAPFNTPKSSLLIALMKQTEQSAEQPPYMGGGLAGPPPKRLPDKCAYMYLKKVVYPRYEKSRADENTIGLSLSSIAIIK